MVFFGLSVATKTSYFLRLLGATKTLLITNKYCFVSLIDDFVLATWNKWGLIRFTSNGSCILINREWQQWKKPWLDSSPENWAHWCRLKQRDAANSKWVATQWEIKRRTDRRTGTLLQKDDLIFRCILASLSEALSARRFVGPLVRWSVSFDGITMFTDFEWNEYWIVSLLS